MADSDDDVLSFLHINLTPRKIELLDIADACINSLSTVLRPHREGFKLLASDFHYRYRKSDDDDTIEGRFTIKEPSECSDEEDYSVRVQHLNGKIHGKYELQRVTGNSWDDESYQCEFEAGQLHGSYKRFYNGQECHDMIECQYRHGIQDGPYLEHEKWGYEIRAHYTNGQLNGPYIKYSLDFGSPPKAVIVCTYVNGKYEGLYEETDAKGNPIRKGLYVNGCEEGLWISYCHKNPFMATSSSPRYKVEAEYSAGEFHGKLIEYNFEGSLDRIGYYQHGKRRG